MYSNAYERHNNILSVNLSEVIHYLFRRKIVVPVNASDTFLVCKAVCIAQGIAWLLVIAEIHVRLKEMSIRSTAANERSITKRENSACVTMIQLRRTKATHFQTSHTKIEEQKKDKKNNENKKKRHLKKRIAAAY